MNGYVFYLRHAENSLTFHQFVLKSPTSYLFICISIITLSMQSHQPQCKYKPKDYVRINSMNVWVFYSINFFGTRKKNTIFMTNNFSFKQTFVCPPLSLQKPQTGKKCIWGDYCYIIFQRINCLLGINMHTSYK